MKYYCERIGCKFLLHENCQNPERNNIKFSCTLLQKEPLVTRDGFDYIEQLYRFKYGNDEWRSYKWVQKHLEHCPNVEKFKVLAELENL